MKFCLNIPTRLIFGAGELNKLSTLPLPGKKALIVISSGTSMKRYGYLDRLQAQLAKAGIDSVTFDKILPNPIKSHVMEGAELCRTQACDFVIGLGGGRFLSLVSVFHCLCIRRCSVTISVKLNLRKNLGIYSYVPTYRSTERIGSCASLIFIPPPE